jgi:hypothetical protein
VIYWFLFFFIFSHPATLGKILLNPPFSKGDNSPFIVDRLPFVKGDREGFVTTPTGSLRGAKPLFLKNLPLSCGTPCQERGSGGEVSNKFIIKPLYRYGTFDYNRTV